MIVALALVLATEPAIGHPYAPAQRGPRTVDLRTVAPPRAEPPARSFHDLDDWARAPEPMPTEPRPGRLPADLVQQPGGVIPRDVAEGRLVIEPETIFAVEDIPGNAYPRKHTLYLNFVGGELLSGADNSAESRSTLARQGPYPAFGGGEATALAAVQAVQNDVAAYGIRVVYEQRPPKTLPYTMTMIGGSWTDTNLESPASGVAPIADCGALGQRHVVYVFANGGWGAIGIANVVSQEAGHAWGLDHNLNCSSVMSYCGGGDGSFSTNCDGLCEDQCQGAAGCRLTHEMFCGEGSDQQNEDAELAWIFGGNEPDMEPPVAEIVAPADGSVVPAGSSVDVRAVVDDNYGGFGWRFVIERDGVVEWDQPDYDRDVDDQYRAALNLVNLEAGAYTVTVEAMDHYEHVVSHSIAFTVEPAAGETGATGVDDSGGDDEGSTAGDDGPSDTAQGEDDSDDGAEETTGGNLTGDDGGTAPSGCSCSTEATPGAWTMLGGLALLRRRKRR